MNSVSYTHLDVYKRQVFILEARANAEGAIYKTMLFYALLVLGPVLAFFGIWFVVKDQGQKSTYAELQMREAEKRLRIAIDGAKCGVWDWNITDDNVYLTTCLLYTSRCV